MPISVKNSNFADIKYQLMKKIMLVLMAALPFQSMATTQQNIELRIIQTSDVHGCFFLTTSLNGSRKKVQWPEL